MGRKPRVSFTKRILKSGNGLYVALPSEVIERWNLDKGDQVSLSIDEGTVKIMPKQATKVESISEEAIEAYSTAMSEIAAKVTLDSEKGAIHVEFSGENKRVINLFAENLWRNLPVMLRLLGLGSVDEANKAHSEEGT